MEIYGELPTGPVLFAACDSRYFLQHAEAFTYSADSIGRDVHIHIANPTPETLSLACVLSATTSVRVTYTFNDFNLNFTPEELITYYACLRFLVLPSLLPHAEKMLVLDIDCLLVNTFVFPDHPCGYFPRNEVQNTTDWVKEGSKVAAGAVYFTAEAMNVVQAIAKTIETIPLNWYADQVALSSIFKQVPDQFVHKFDAQFMDWEFHEGTIIWTGKGPRKHENARYLEKKRSFEVRASTCQGFAHVILAPRLDIPFKKNGLLKADPSPLPEIRQYWGEFIDGLRVQLDSPLQIEMPRWMFHSSIQNLFPEGTVFLVPHVEKQNWHGNEFTLYYMQTVFPWMFTVDSIGWGGGAGFVSAFDQNKPYDDKPYNDLAKYVRSGGTKFQQPVGRSLEIEGAFIFVPLQLPHDETILWHSDISCMQFVEALCQWADQSSENPRIVFKGHPINLASMGPLKQVISGYERSTYVTDVDIHEMIPRSEAVYVINSGVGQEAMLYDAPVVHFGRCEYQGATIPGDIHDLSHTWNMVVEDDRLRRAEMYRRWYHWYVNEVCLSARYPTADEEKAG